MSTDASRAVVAEPGRETAILITVALTTMLAPLNSTMIGVALPEIMSEFDASLGSGSWLVIAYLIAMAALQPVGGKLGDRLGRRPMVLVGLIYFALASLGAALAVNMPQLLVFRVQQAIAGAVAFPNGMAIIREVIPVERRAARIGLLGSAIVLAAAAGPPLAGAIIGLAGWRAVFSMNLVVVVPAVFLALRVLPAQTGDRVRRPFDGVGVLQLLLVLAGGATLLTGGLPLSVSWILFVTGLLLFVAVRFVIREGRHPDPLLQPRFFLRRTFAAGCAGVALSNLSMYTTFLTIPLLLGSFPGWSSTRVGLVLSALWAPSVVCAPIGGRLADRWGRRWPTTLGLSLLSAGMASLALLQVGASSLWVTMVGLGVAGVGLGLSQASLQTAVLEAVPVAHAGSASGIYSTSRYVGSIAGASVLPMLYGGAVTETAGFMRVLVVVVAAAALGVITSFGIEHHPRPD